MGRSWRVSCNLVLKGVGGVVSMVIFIGLEIKTNSSMTFGLFSENLIKKKEIEVK